jgi:hypothetical protein
MTRQTLINWAKMGLLPQPTRVHLGRRGVSSEWPPFTIELAIWVKQALDRRLTMQAVAIRVKPLLAQTPAWVDSELAQGQSVATLIERLNARAGGENVP